MSYDLYYSDEKGNKIYIPSENNYHPRGDLNYVFKSTNSIIRIGKNVNLVKANFIIARNSYVEIGDNCRIKGQVITKNTNSKIIIGNETKFNGQGNLYSAEGCTIKIGSGCLFSNVKFRTSDTYQLYDLENNERINKGQDIILGDNIWIAEGVTVFKGVTIGSHSIIGGRSKVTQNLPSSAICVGSPAKPIKYNMIWKEHI